MSQTEQQKTQSVKLSIDHLTRALEDFHDAFEQKLMGIPYPSQMYPDGYISAIDHYMKKYMEYSIFPPDILRRLYVARIVPESISFDDGKRVRDFVQLINEITHFIRGGIVVDA